MKTISSLSNIRCTLSPFVVFRLSTPKRYFIRQKVIDKEHRKTQCPSFIPTFCITFKLDEL